MGLLGATDEQTAAAIGISVRMLAYWKRKHPEFLQALKESHQQADANVTESLYRRALGYKAQAVKIVADAKTGASTVVPYIEHYPPDPTACIFWLKNRRPDLWREKQPGPQHGGGAGAGNNGSGVPEDVLKRARETFEKKYGQANQPAQPATAK